MSQRRAVLIKIASVTAAILTVAFLIGIAKPTPAFAGTGTVTTAPVPAALQQAATSRYQPTVKAPGFTASVRMPGAELPHFLSSISPTAA